MGELLTFLHRARDAGGWTPAERARLEALADSYGGGGGRGFEVVFGASDAGDPWCAVKDSEDEVVVHVARIGDRVVAHFPLDETLAEGPDLYSTLREWLRGHEDGVVVAFNPHGREGQSLLALLLAAALLEDELGAPRQWLAPAAGGTPLLQMSPDSRGAAPEPPPEPLAQSGYSPPEAPSAEPDLAVTSAPPTARLDPAPPAAASTAIASRVEAETSTPTASSPTAPLELARAGHAFQAPGGTQQVIRGAAGDDLLAGSPGAEKLVGGAGNDTLRGGGGGDTLEGGRGDDWIELAGDSFAIGGEGADTFVVQAPTVQSAGDKPLLGVVVDFRPDEGDRLVTSEGVVITGPSSPSSLTSLQTAGPAGDRGRVAVDFDQDGVAEGFVVLRGEQAAPGEEGLLHTPERFSEGWIGF